MAKKKIKEIPKEQHQSIYPQVYIAGGCVLGVLSLLICNSVPSMDDSILPMDGPTLAVSEAIINTSTFLSNDLLTANDSEKMSHSKKTKTSAKKQSRCPSPSTHFGMRCKKSCALTLEGDYLFWKAQEDGLAYATELPGWLPGENAAFVNNAHLVEHSPNWGSGFRVGIGENLTYGLWDLGFDWTYYNHRNTNHLHSDTSSIIAITVVPLLATNDTFTVTDASSAWHLRFSMMDLAMGRKFLVGDHFTLRPNAGLKGGWINQIQTIKYSGLTTLTYGALSETKVKKINDFAGIGPEVGIDLRWLLGHQFGIFGTMNTALLYGRFDVKTEFFFEDSLLTNVPTLIDSKHRLRPTLQLLLGLDWEKCIGKRKIGLGAGYEVQYWWNQQQNFYDIYTITPAPAGDLTMHGLTAKLKFEF